jgi:hypothetical protein
MTSLSVNGGDATQCPADIARASGCDAGTRFGALATFATPDA